MKVRATLGRLAKATLVLALALASLLVFSFVDGILTGFSSSSSPGDPSSAGVVDSDVFWSPDSRLIAFDRSEYASPDDTSSGPTDVFVAGADGSGLRQVTRTSHDETVLGWLPDPLRIVYSIRAAKEPAKLYALALDGKAPVLIGQLRASEQLLALSHDARRALVGTPWREPKRYALVDLVRGTRRLLPGFAAYWPNGAWSSDDSMLAYVTSGEIVVLRGDRIFRRIPLGRYDSASGGLAWCPEGRRLAYGSGGDYGSLWLVSIEDGSRTRVTGGGDTIDDYPFWSPDGNTIYYQHGSFGDHDGLRAIAPDGTGDRMVTVDDWGGSFFSGKGGRWLDEATISPDGTRMAYLLNEFEGWKNWSLVGVMDADGGDKTALPASL